MAVDQEEGVGMARIIPYKEWKKFENAEILANIEVSIRVLRERELTSEERRHAGELAKDLIDLAIRGEETE